MGRVRAIHRRAGTRAFGAPFLALVDDQIRLRPQDHCISLMRQPHRKCPDHVEFGRVASIRSGPLQPSRRERRLRCRLRGRYQGAALACDREQGSARCSSTSSIAGRAGARPTRVTARASSCRRLTLPPQGRFRSRCPSQARTAPGWYSCRATSATARRSVSSSPPWCARKARRCSVGATCRATTASSGTARRRRSRCSSSCSSGPHRPRGRPTIASASSASSTSSASASSTRLTRVAINALSRRFFYIVSLSANTLTYKGMLTARQLAPMFPDLTDPASRVVSGARASAVQHQHVSLVAARASVPLCRAQRRDQHAARQHQLDAGPRRPAAERRARRRPREGRAGASAKGAATRLSSTTCSSS